MMKKNMPIKNEDEIFSEENEVKNVFFSFGKIGDYIKGTLLAIREVNSTLPGHEGEKVKVYDVKVKSGVHHLLDDKKNVIEPGIVLEEGSYISVGDRVSFSDQMRMIKIGQIFALKFVEEKPAKKKGFNPYKLVKLYQGTMDEEYAADKLEEEFKLPPM